MHSIEELIESVRIETLSNLIKQNSDLIKMKYNDFNSNLTFGRTFSLGQWFGYLLGLEIAKKLEDHEVLIDTCLTTIKRYPLENKPNSKKRKSLYPDILIVKKFIGDVAGYDEFIQENKKTIKKYKLDANINYTNIYDVKAIIEVKMDPGYIDLDELSSSFLKLNQYLIKNEEFSFKKIYTKHNEENEFFIKNIVRMNSQQVAKCLILATEANHSERIEEIKMVCEGKKFDYIALTNSSKHVRDYKISEIPKLRNLIK